MAWWLMKSEPDEVSIDDLARLGRVPWFGVRNFQARNFMRDVMRVGDEVLFYHSSCAEPGIAGLCKVASGPRPDATQFDLKSPYYDPRSSPEDPRWMCVEVEFLAKTRLISLKCARRPSLPACRCSRVAIVCRSRR
jgi:predicted RNA-binding protein with PUA-like domain